MGEQRLILAASMSGQVLTAPRVCWIERTPIPIIIIWLLLVHLIHISALTAWQNLYRKLIERATAKCPCRSRGGGKLCYDVTDNDKADTAKAMSGSDDEDVI